MSERVEKWGCFELALAGPTAGNPFQDVTMGADFSLGNSTIHVPGFYDGDGIYKVRFMPGAEGHWEYVTVSNSTTLNHQRGALDCVPASAGNHGPVRVADQTHFAYADGTPYIPVGTTCYVWNLQGDALEERTLKTLDTAPFNKMRMSVFPKRYSYNSNEPPTYPFPARFTGTLNQPWSREMVAAYFRQEPPHHLWDLERFNPQHFQHLEQRILDLQARGIEADLILFHPYDYGAWGFDRLPAEVNDRYLQYITARLSAFRNVWWSFANEYDLFIGLQMADWDHRMQLVQQIDPYHHLRSIHNCGSFYDHTQPWVTHCSVQSHALQRMPQWIQMYAKPVVVDECGYEGDISMVWGDLSAEELLLRFWVGFTEGGFVGHGETYINPQGELWWSKGGRLIGKSVERIAFLRKVFEDAPPLTPVVRVDNEFNCIDMSSGNPFRTSERMVDNLITEGTWNFEAAGYHGDDFFLCYLGMHQPGTRNFSLADGSFRVDVIDTWKMTIETFSENASGTISVPMPARKFMAIRVQRNEC
jgi:hypothetical protein